MSVVRRLSDWPQPADRRSTPMAAKAGSERPSAEIIILPCVRHERPDMASTEAARA